MSKKTRVFLLRGACFLLGACLLFAALSRLLNDKYSYKAAAPFYQGGDAYEVLFFGSSHMYDGVFPLAVYRESGVLSYNLGMTGETMCTTYWRIRDALDRCTPRVVVVDVYAAADAEKLPFTEEKLAFLHNSLDGMPLCPVKVRALGDIFGTDIAQTANYLFPLAQYHSRYSSLTADDYEPFLNADGGALPLRVWKPVWEGMPDTAGVTAPLGAAGEAYLRRIAALCAGRGVALVLAAIPYQPHESGELALLDSVAAFAAENGLPFLNLFEVGIIDPFTDFADGDGHLNTRGGNALSVWLARWLTAHYALTDRRGDAVAAAWDGALADGLRRHAAILAEADLDTALMLLAQPGLGWQLRLSDAALQREETQRFLAGLPYEANGNMLQTGTPPAGAALPEGENALLAWDQTTGEVLVQRAF